MLFAVWQRAISGRSPATFPGKCRCTSSCRSFLCSTARTTLQSLCFQKTRPWAGGLRTRCISNRRIVCRLPPLSPMMQSSSKRRRAYRICSHIQTPRSNSSRGQLPLAQYSSSSGSHPLGRFSSRRGNCPRAAHFSSSGHFPSPLLH